MLCRLLLDTTSFGAYQSHAGLLRMAKLAVGITTAADREPEGMNTNRQSGLAVTC